jgi:hypothetical protein
MLAESIVLIQNWPCNESALLIKGFVILALLWKVQ